MEQIGSDSEKNIRSAIFMYMGIQIKSKISECLF